MNYYIVPIIEDELAFAWKPNVSIKDYDAKCYNIPTDCKIKTPEICAEGTPITEEQYNEAC